MQWQQYLLPVSYFHFSVSLLYAWLFWKMTSLLCWKFTLVYRVQIHYAIATILVACVLQSLQNTTIEHRYQWFSEIDTSQNILTPVRIFVIDNCQTYKKNRSMWTVPPKKSKTEKLAVLLRFLARLINIWFWDTFAYISATLIFWGHSKYVSGPRGQPKSAWRMILKATKKYPVCPLWLFPLLVH